MRSVVKGIYIVLLSIASIAIQAKSFVPPGFEDLLEPQTTEVDVYYGGVYVAATLATFTPGEITFLDPESLVARIPDLIDPELVVSKLSGDLSTNAGLVCLSQNQQNCGRIVAEDVEVIFDEGRFRVDLFISPALLSVRDARISKFLPPSDSGLSLLNVVSASVNGREGEQENYNVSNSTTLAYKESRLLAISNFTKDDHLTFDTLALQRELNGQQVQAGIFRSSPAGLVFVREADFLGVSLASSLDTRTDLDQSSGNELQVFLESRSRVDILKDGRLISTATYETGNQILDTSQLPGGAYDIVLRIRDNFGITTEETRFYVKSNRLPPKDQSLYFFDIGEQVSKQTDRSLPKSTGKKFLRAGLSKRLTEEFGGEIGLVYNDDDTLAEAGFFKLGRRYDVRLNLAAGSSNSRGISMTSNLHFARFSIASNIRKTWSDKNDGAVGVPLTQASVNLSAPLGTGALNLTARYNKRDSGVDKNYSIRYDIPTFSFYNQLLTSNFQLTRNNDDYLVLLSARLSVKKGRWQTDFNTRGYYDNSELMPTDSGLISTLSSTWRDGDRYLSDVSVAFRAVDEQADKSLESELNIASRYGRANLEAIYSTDTDKLNYGANFYTSVIANTNSFSIGGKSQARSALVLDIEGDTEDAFFDVEVNRLVRDKAVIGRKTILPLAPFETYEVALKPKGASLLDFSNQTKTTTLYPGNVVTLKWTASRILVAFGQITDTNGEPIANALIQGVVGLATTDEFGLFQAEMSSDTRTFNVKTRAQSCQVELPDYDSSQMIATLGQLVCR